MAKDTFYFSHDYNARNDEKILALRERFGPEGYGIFWMIVETMAENESGRINSKLIGGLSLGYGTTKEKLQSILDFCHELGLFKVKKDSYLSDRMMRYKEYRKSLSESGKEGAIKRWAGHRVANGVANGIPNANKRKGKERKEKEKKIKKGGYFLENQTKVVYDGGEVQDLTAEETELARQGKLLPKDFEKEIA